jgi:hypothetical protein
VAPRLPAPHPDLATNYLSLDVNRCHASVVKVSVPPSRSVVSRTMIPSADATPTHWRPLAPLELDFRQPIVAVVVTLLLAALQTLTGAWLARAFVLRRWSATSEDLGR